MIDRRMNIRIQRPEDLRSIILRSYKSRLSKLAEACPHRLRRCKGNSTPPTVDGS